MLACQLLQVLPGGCTMCCTCHQDNNLIGLGQSVPTAELLQITANMLHQRSLLTHVPLAVSLKDQCKLFNLLIQYSCTPAGASALHWQQVRSRHQHENFRELEH